MKSIPNSPSNNNLSADTLHMYRQIFLKLAQNTPFDIEVDDSLPAAMAMSTANIAKPKLCINPRMCEEQFHFTPQEYGLIFSHEYFHYYEESFLRATPIGDTRYKQFLDDHISAKKPYAKAYHTLYNCLRDIYVNWSTLQKFPTWNVHMQQLYVQKLFPGVEYTSLPKHMQFIYALLRESMVPSEKCIVDSNVRKQVDFQLIQDKQFGARIQEAANPAKSLQDRLTYIATHIEPWFTYFLQQDIEKKKAEKDNDNQQNQNPPQEGDQKNEERNTTEGENKNTNKSNSADTNTDRSEQETNEGSPSTQPSQKLGDENTTPGENSDIPTKTDGEKSSSTSQTAGSEGGNEEPLRDDAEYEKGQMPHIIEKTLTPDEIKQFQDSLDAYTQEEAQKQEDAKLDPQERRLRDKLAAIGIDPDDNEYEEIKEQLRRIDDLHLEDILNPDSHKPIIQEIEEMLRNIAGRRTKQSLQNRGPVDMDKGSRLHLPSITSGITDVLMGKSDPAMFELDAKRERPAVFVGDFDLLLIADGSSSMGDEIEGETGKKNKQQQKAIMLILEAINRLHLGMQGDHLKRKLTCYTQVKIFTGKTIKELKKYDTLYTDRERIDVMMGLDTCASTTGDYAAIADLANEHNTLDEKKKHSIKKGERKKIVIVMTDGQSDDASKLKHNIRKLRETGVIVIGIGVTRDGAPVVENYKATGDKALGYGVVCPDVRLLPLVLFETLKPHIQTL